MALQYRAAVLHAAQTPMSIETITAAELKPNDVLVRIRAAGLCHTDLEVIEGSLRYPLPIVLGHEAAGVVEQVGAAARGVKAGDHVVLSWNPHCGHCFYCDRDAPILCEQYLGEGPKGVAFDGETRTTLADGRQLQQLMFLGSFGEYCVVSDQQAIPVPKEIPFDRACLIGCGVMTGAGAALNLGAIAHGDTVMVIGCGAVVSPRCRARGWRARARLSPSISIRQNSCSRRGWARRMASMPRRTMRSPRQNGKPTAAASMS